MTKKNKKITIAIIILLVITAIGVTMAVSHYSKPDFTKMTPQQIRQYFDSNQFRDANEDKRQEMREQMGEAMMARAEKQANEYAALSADEKTVYLDKIIDEMQAQRAEFSQETPTTPTARLTRTDSKIRPARPQFPAATAWDSKAGSSVCLSRRE